MELRPDRLERQLASEPLRPVYLVAGAEPLLVQEAADAIRARAREEGYGERQVLDAEGSFDWNELSLQPVRPELHQSPRSTTSMRRRIAACMSRRSSACSSSCSCGLPPGASAS